MHAKCESSHFHACINLCERIYCIAIFWGLFPLISVSYELTCSNYAKRGESQLYHSTVWTILIIMQNDQEEPHTLHDTLWKSVK